MDPIEHTVNEAMKFCMRRGDYFTLMTYACVLARLKGRPYMVRSSV